MPLSLANFNGAYHENHVMHAPAFAASTPTDVGFIGLDVFLVPATNPVLIGAYHADAQLVKNLECGLVARERELSLKLNSRHARRLTGHQVHCPEPDQERRVCALHDGASGEARITTTFSTTQHTGASGDTVRLTGCTTTRTDEAMIPPHALKVACIGCLVWKQPLKFRQ